MILLQVCYSSGGTYSIGRYSHAHVHNRCALRQTSWLGKNTMPPSDAHTHRRIRKSCMAGIRMRALGQNCSATAGVAGVGAPWLPTGSVLPAGAYQLATVQASMAPAICNYSKVGIRDRNSGRLAMILRDMCCTIERVPVTRRFGAFPALPLSKAQFRGWPETYLGWCGSTHQGCGHGRRGTSSGSGRELVIVGNLMGQECWNQETPNMSC